LTGSSRLMKAGEDITGHRLVPQRDYFAFGQATST
jgi:hypothetical protein